MPFAAEHAEHVAHDPGIWLHPPPGLTLQHWNENPSYHRYTTPGGTVVVVVVVVVVVP